MEAVRMLTEQLWGPGLDGRVQASVLPRRERGTELGRHTAEQYWLLGGPTSPRLLVPAVDSAVQRAALTHYRGLRRPLANVGRAVLGTLAGAGTPLATHRLVVQTETATEAALLPLAVLADALGHDRLHATFGVRVGANRKATLQLLADDGTSVGYAKLGWNTTANEYVRNEAITLAELSAWANSPTSAMRAPSLLSRIDQGGRPVAVVAPLPADVRGARGSLATPTAQEFYALMPVTRSARPGETLHLKALADRLADLSEADVLAESRAVLSQARELCVLIGADSRSVPVQSRWHGDLTPWNCARQPDGQLWAWDWESSEPDVVAGLDVLHWHFSVAREAGNWEQLRLADCVSAGSAHLKAAGTSESSFAVTQGVYALSVVERAATLAVRDGGWGRVWIRPERLAALLDEARNGLSRSN